MDLAQLDQQLFILINSQWAHPVLDVFFPWWTDFQKTPLFHFLFLPLLLGVIYWKGRWKGFGILVLGILVASLADWISGEVLKDIFQRPRPAFSEIAEFVKLRGPRAGGFSFPSSHSMVAFALISFVSVFYSKLKWPLIAFAFLTAYSRVYCGVHFPGDVFVGALLGAALGYSLGQVAYKVLRQRGIDF